MAKFAVLREILMRRSTVPTKLLLALALPLACARKPSEPPSIPSASEPAAPAPVIEAPAPVAAPELLRLARALHPATMTEVTLDPRGQSAITLDVDGGARLWPDVRADAQAPPIVLPLAEPAWITLARAGADRIVIAAIDTAGATRVAEVELAGDTPRWRPLFAIPASDPHLEIHVLGGGERLLALSLDHRLRVLDREGRSISTLDVPGFIPWQLRLAHAPEGPPKIVAILAGPVRAQPITMEGDALTITGEARRVDLDRGPNRNDVILSPDGAFVTSLRRPRAKGTAWSLELIDLATDARRWIAGDVDGPVRPRLHLLSATEALLEGGTGQGHRVDLTKARLAAPGEKIDRKKLPKTKTQAIPIAGSTEDSRMLGDLAGGVRAFAVGRDLFIEPVDGGPGRTIATREFSPAEVALDPAGERLAWILGERLQVEAIGDPSGPRTIGDPIAQPLELAFVDADHLLVVGSLGELRVVRWGDGSKVAEAIVRSRGGLQDARYHPRGGGGALALRSQNGREPRQILEVGVDALGAPRPLTDGEHGEWIDLAGTPPAVGKQVAALFGVEESDQGRALVHGAVIGDRRYAALTGPMRVAELRGDVVLALPLSLDRWATVHPAAERRRVAVRQSTGGADRSTTITVVDFDGEAPRRLWSRAFAVSHADLAWSEDGSRLAVAAKEAGGLVVDGATGEAILERRDLGLEVTAITRDPAARSGSARSSG